VEAEESLQAYLFSDRGIYRPGDQIHIGLLVKRADWKAIPDGLPLELTHGRGYRERGHREPPRREAQAEVLKTAVQKHAGAAPPA
jgi:hypothetical protein